MNIHILGICGTFMGGLAALAAELNYKVSGADQNIYPPMSTQLNQLGIDLHLGYDAAPLIELMESQPKPKIDTIVVGNVMRRGHPVIEYILNQGLSIQSGPEWLAQTVLKNRHVLAVSGTHGKTTTSSMLAWILDFAELEPGFLIGGIAQNFGVSARLGKGKYFVIEADEYDSAFFDKRSKFIHYRPNTLIINNLEYDHADIFPDLNAIQTQFHHLIRTIPQSGLIIAPEDKHIDTVLNQGYWTPVVRIGEKNENLAWDAVALDESCSEFILRLNGKKLGTVNWALIGRHNMLNGLAAIAAAHHVGVEPDIAIEALNRFEGVKRRLELKASKNDIQIFDDFAHHPTAIQTTLAGLKAKNKSKGKIYAVLDLRSNTMRLGTHRKSLPGSLAMADKVFLLQTPDIEWDVERVYQETEKPGGVFQDPNQLMQTLQSSLTTGDKVVFMSNGGFAGLPDKFAEWLLLDTHH